jgi:CzcA family heavy metal efflux pump
MNVLLDALIRASIRRRHLVITIAIVLAAIGIALGFSARLDALPSFTPPMVVVQAEAPGMASTFVEERVTTPLEQALLGTPDVVQVRSTSSPGLSVIEMTFSDDADVFQARQLVGERLLEARARLPATVPAPRLAPIAAPVGALLRFCLTTSEGQDGMRNLWRFAEWELRPRVQSIEGVSRVTVHGGAPDRVEVRPEPAAMLARKIDFAELAQALESAAGLVPLGDSQLGAMRQPLRSDTTWSIESLESIGATVVDSEASIPVRVEDVAEVGIGSTPAVGAARYDGAPAIYIQVDKVPWADTLDVTRAVDTALRDLDKSLPPGARRQTAVFRQADFVRTSLGSVGRAMAIGGVFLIVILVAFLRSPRLAAISLIAIPASIVAATTVLLVRGVTINGMILGGLAIAVGEVVDDAIVDVENIWKRLRENAASAEPRPALEVIHDASAEVRGAVVYATLVVVAVLAPIMLLTGIAGRIFSPLAEAYALAMAASLVVALTLTPALAAVLLPRLAASGTEDTAFTRRLLGQYDRVLVAVRRRPGKITALAAIVGALGLAGLPLLGGGFLPEFREGVMIADVTTWPGTSLEETTRLAKRLDANFRSPGGASHVAMRIGRASLDEDAAPAHRMEIDVVVPSDADPEELVETIAQRAALLPGIRFGIEGFLGERINELLSGERAPIAIKLYGEELADLRAWARRLSPQLRSISGVQMTRSDALADTPTQDLDIDEAALAMFGLSRIEIARMTAAWRMGLPVGEARAKNGFSVPVVIMTPQDTADGSRLADFPVFSKRGAVLPLSAMANIVQRSEPDAIRHEQGRRLVAVTLGAPSGEISRIAGEAHKVLSESQPPPGASWEISGQATERSQARIRLALTALGVLAVVFVFLWVAFGTVIDSLVVLGGLPLGLFGGVAVAALLPEGASVAGLVGFVTLLGIISRNGIMLVMHKNHLLSARGGGSVESLILRAARERLVPILMTAGAAFFGLLPLALGLGGAGSELESPMAAIVCGGVLTSTVLNLIAVPAFFVWRDRRAQTRTAT